MLFDPLQNVKCNGIPHFVKDCIVMFILLGSFVPHSINEYILSPCYNGMAAAVAVTATTAMMMTTMKLANYSDWNETEEQKEKRHKK